jgi:hypothetical protein
MDDGVPKELVLAHRNWQLRSSETPILESCVSQSWMIFILFRSWKACLRGLVRCTERRPCSVDLVSFAVRRRAWSEALERAMETGPSAVFCALRAISALALVARAGKRSRKRPCRQAIPKAPVSIFATGCYSIDKEALVCGPRHGRINYHTRMMNSAEPESPTQESSTDTSIILAKVLTKSTRRAIKKSLLR